MKVRVMPLVLLLALAIALGILHFPEQPISGSVIDRYAWISCLDERMPLAF